MRTFTPYELLHRWAIRRPATGPPLPYAPAPFDVMETRSRGRVIRLTVNGDIDLLARDRLRTALIAAATSNASEVCVDLAGATFLDCSGIGALVGGRNAAINSDCRFRVTHAHGIVAHVLNVTGLLEFLGCDQPTRSRAAEYSVPRGVVCRR